MKITTGFWYSLHKELLLLLALPVLAVVLECIKKDPFRFLAALLCVILVVSAIIYFRRGIPWRLPAFRKNTCRENS